MLVFIPIYKYLELAKGWSGVRCTFKFTNRIRTPLRGSWTERRLNAVAESRVEQQ